MSGQPLHHPGNSNRRRRVCPPQGLTALSGNTSDASDTVCTCRPGRVLQARTKCRRLDVCTTYRRQLFCCFSLPLLRDNAGCDGESGHEISSGVCLLFSRTQRLVFGLTVAWGWRRAGGDASEPCKSFAGRASRGPCACACAVLRRSPRSILCLQEGGRLPWMCRFRLGGQTATCRHSLAADNRWRRRCW